MNNEIQVRKIIFKEFPKLKYYIFFSFFISLLLQSISLIPPVFMEKIVDIYIPNKNINSTFLSVFFFVMIPVLCAVISTISNYFFNIIGRKIGQRLMLECFEKLLYQPVKYYESHNSSETAYFCKNESMNYISFWIFDIPQLFSKIIIGIIVSIVIFRINIFLSLFMLLYIPLSVLPSNYFSKKIKNYVESIINNNAKANQIITDTFRGIKHVKTALLEEYRIRKLKIINDDSIKTWSKTSAIDNLNGTWTTTLVDSMFTGIIFAVSAFLIIKDCFTIGSLLLIMNYLPKFFSVVKFISNTNFNFKKQLAECSNFFAFLTMEDEKNSDNNKNEFQFNSSIKFENVSFRYDKDKPYILKNLSMNFEKNKFIGIIGISGSGKTTILDLLIKLYDNYSGEIYFDDINLKVISAKSLRQNVTKVSQDMFLFPGTIKENLKMVNESASENEIMNVIREVGLKEFIDNLPDGLDTLIGEDGNRISGGEKQRLCIAQGLLRNSKILLLDEVTANLDKNSEENIKNTILKLMMKYKLTVISISHRIDFLKNADIIYELKNGSINKIR